MAQWMQLVQGYGQLRAQGGVGSPYAKKKTCSDQQAFTGSMHTATGGQKRGSLFFKFQAVTGVAAAQPGVVSRFVALAMKRKHDETVDLNELRQRAGELVARAGLENGEVKEGVWDGFGWFWRMFVA